MNAADYCSLLTVYVARQRWLFNPPFVKFSSRARGKDKVDIPQPSHSLTFLGRCDVEIGPHIFLETKIIEVNYDQVHTGPLNPLVPPAPRASTATDVLLEFRENPTERFLLPLDCSIIERVLRLGVPPTILLSTAVPAIAPEKMISSAPAQHPFTIRFVHAGTPLWEAMQKRVISSKMPIQTVQHILQQAVSQILPSRYIGQMLNDLSQGELIRSSRIHTASTCCWSRPGPDSSGRLFACIDFV